MGALWEGLATLLLEPGPGPGPGPRGCGLGLDRDWPCLGMGFLGLCLGLGFLGLCLGLGLGSWASAWAWAWVCPCPGPGLLGLGLFRLGVPVCAWGGGGSLGCSSWALSAAGWACCGRLLLLCTYVCV